MENRIFIAVGSLLQESEGKYKLYPAVLRNLYKIGHELKRAIYIIYKDKKQKDAITKYILLLANEQIEIRDILSVKDSQKLMKDFPSSQDTVLSPDGGGKDTPSSKQQSLQSVSHEGFVWDNIYASLKNPNRNATVHRDTNETQIKVIVNLDGSGKSDLHTGLGFFDHMLEQVARHGQLDLTVQVNGDLHIDEHHTIEDTGLALGEAFKKALGNKIGIERYGFLLPMDDCLAQVGLDFGGRPWLVWDATFSRENIGDMPTEMFFHFFKSFSDAAACNLNIKAEGENEHHKIEAIFKAFAKSIKMAKTRTGSDTLPSTKGVL